MMYCEILHSLYPLSAPKPPTPGVPQLNAIMPLMGPQGQAGTGRSGLSSVLCAPSHSESPDLALDWQGDSPSSQASSLQVISQHWKGCNEQGGPLVLNPPAAPPP